MKAHVYCLRNCVAALTLAWSPHALPQAYPDRPLRIVVPYLAGGGVDTAARVVGQPLGEQLGQPVLIDNRPGAATNIGSDMVAKAKPDGYTLLLANASQVANVSLYSKMPYDLQKDLAPIVLIGSAPLILLVHPSANKALAAPEAVKRLSAEGVEVSGGSPQVLEAFITKEIEKYGKIVRAAQIKPE